MLNKTLAQETDAGISSGLPDDPTIIRGDTVENASTLMNAPTIVAEISRQPGNQRKLLEPGTLIKNRFQLVKNIGEGGMGVVYTARDHRKEEAGDLDSVVAIKLLSDALESSPNAMRMLQQECVKSQSLAHPNIVTVYDFDREERTFFMTMEYLSGETLEKYLDDNQGSKSSLETVLPYIEGMVKGLEYAHTKGIIHSDLKPANIFITDENNIKILDFGIARAVSASEEELSWIWEGKNADVKDEDSDPDAKNELVAFTPGFASPEMFAGEAPAPCDDIYALACITYYLISGKHPYGKVQADLAKEMDLVPERIEGLNDRQWNTLLSGLSLDSEERISSAAEFLQGFKPPKRQRWKHATIAVAVITVLITGYFMLKPPVVPDIFTNPLPEQAISAQLQQEVADLLELAEMNMLVGRLISPAGSNALDQYQAVLELHPYDRQAIVGLKGLLDIISVQAEESLSSGQYDDVRLLVDAGLKVHAKHKKLNAIKKKLNKTN